MRLPLRKKLAIASCLAGDVDLALAEALQQIVGRQIDQLDLVGPLEDRVRDRLAHDDAGHLGDDVVEALHVLDVHGRVDVEAGVEQLDHVLPALGVTAAGRVGVGQLVDEDQRRLAGQRAVEVELLQRGAAVLDGTARKDLEPAQQRLGLGPAVQLDVADHEVDTVIALLTGGLEHRVRLADAGRGAEEHLQLAATLSSLQLLDAGQQRIGIGPGGAHGASVAPAGLRRSHPAGPVAVPPEQHQAERHDDDCALEHRAERPGRHGAFHQAHPAHQKNADEVEQPVKPGSTASGSRRRLYCHGAVLNGVLTAERPTVASGG